MNVEKITTTKEVVVTEPVTTYVLELDEDELRLLAAVIGNIGGLMDLPTVNRFVGSFYDKMCENIPNDETYKYQRELGLTTLRPVG